jgi:TolA-binding protein
MPLHLLAMFLLTAPAAQAFDASQPPPDPEEVEAWRQTAGRVHDRMTEFEADTRSFVDLREREERRRILQGFDGQIAEYQTLEATERQKAMEKFEAFVQKYPNEAYSDHVRFRLADLYFEDSFQAYDDQMKAYEAATSAAEASGDLAGLEALTEPKLDLQRSIDLYNTILDRNRPLPPAQRYERLDGVYLMLGFCYTDEQSKQQSTDEARKIFEDLATTMPDSDLADRAHLNLGNFLFQLDSKFQEAIAEYQKVYDRGEAGPYFEESIYQLAWAKYKLNQYDDSLALFVQLLDLSERDKADTGKDSPYAKDAVRFMAFTFADQAQMADTPALNVAEAYFTKIGPRDYERKVYIQLTDVLMRYTRPEEAIDVYAKLQDDPRWRNEPDNPEWQQAIIDLYTANLQTRDLAAGGQARLDLTNRYGEDSPWQAANRENPEAVAKARELIEKNLIDVAIEYRVRADETGTPEDLNLAVDKYREYLTRFPLADDYYEQKWNLAATEIKAKRWAEAETELEPLVRAVKHHNHDDAVIYSLFDVRYALFQADGLSADKLPDGAQVERTYTTPFGKQIQVYSYGQRTRKLISAADGVMTHTFDGLPAGQGEEVFKQTAEERQPDFLYLTGQIPFYYFRFDEARPRLQAVIDRYPHTAVASYAADLIVKSYEIEGDLGEVRSHLEQYLAMNLGEATAQPATQTKLHEALEDAAFLQAQQLASAQKYDEAAAAYSAFYHDFPNSKHAADSLFNSARYYEEAGKADQANQVYEQFANRFPDDPHAEKIYFNVAENYRSTFDLDKAVDYYQRLVQRFPTSQNAPIALYNAGFLKIGLRDYLGAAHTFEEYATKYPQEADREQVDFLAGEQYDQVDHDLALRFYQGYLNQYGYQNPDNALQAMWRIAEINQEKGNTKQFEAKRAEIVRAFDQIAASGKPIGPRGQKYAAEAAFPTIVEAWNAYSKDKLPANEAATTKLLTVTKPAELKELDAQLDAFVAKYASFEHRSGALYYKAMLPLYLADLGHSIAPPKGLNEQQTSDYYEILEEKVYPIYNDFEKAGIQRLSELVEAAKTAKQHSKWIDEAQAELNRRDPTTYAAPVRELTGQPDATIPPQLQTEGSTAPAGSPWNGNPAPAPGAPPASPPVVPKEAPAPGTPPPSPPVQPKESP